MFVFMERKTRDLKSAFLNLQIYEVSSSSSVGITKSIFYALFLIA